MTDSERAILNMQIALARSTKNWAWLKKNKKKIAGKDAGLENNIPQPQEEKQ